MKWIQNIIGGLAGALALNILHETAKRYIAEAPRLDLVGEEAVSKTVAALGQLPPVGKKLFIETLGADITANAFYYMLIGDARNKYLLLRGAGMGLVAGLGALNLTKPLGLDDKPVTATTTTKLLTVSLYLAGGLVAASVIKALRPAGTGE